MLHFYFIIIQFSNPAPSARLITVIEGFGAIDIVFSVETLQCFQTCIDSLDECGEVLRAKGIVENADGGWLEFDYVPGEGEVRATDAEATGMVAVIGTRLNKDKLKELFKLA